ncbi:MAG: twin-arginine translocation signal domain-containing protein [Planctomycetota bacterium]
MSGYHLTRRSFLKTTGMGAASLMATSSLVFSEQTIRENPT